MLITGHHGLHARIRAIGPPLQDHDFWSAHAQSADAPQIVSRTGGALLLSSLYVYLHAAFTSARRGCAS